MHISVARLAMLVFLIGLPARADDLADFNAAVEAAASHQRVALGYLRTGNIDLATLEIDRMRTAWSRVTTLKRPAALKHDPQLYTTTMLDISTKLIGISIMMNSGRPEAARKSLEDIRAELKALRKANGVVIFADCIADANAAMDRLMVFNDAALDWSKPDTAPAISAAATEYQRQLSRCNDLADAKIGAAPEFRRLIEGAKNSLSQIPTAISRRDPDLLHRLLIELRSFDNLLAFRYG